MLPIYSASSVVGVQAICTIAKQRIRRPSFGDGHEIRRSKKGLKSIADEGIHLKMQPA
jgi:hypothetical protein